MDINDREQAYIETLVNLIFAKGSLQIQRELEAIRLSVARIPQDTADKISACRKDREESKRKNWVMLLTIPGIVAAIISTAARLIP